MCAIYVTVASANWLVKLTLVDKESTMETTAARDNPIK